MFPFCLTRQIFVCMHVFFPFIQYSNEGCFRGMLLQGSNKSIQLNKVIYDYYYFSIIWLQLIDLELRFHPSSCLVISLQYSEKSNKTFMEQKYSNTKQRKTYIHRVRRQSSERRKYLRDTRVRRYIIPQRKPKWFYWLVILYFFFVWQRICFDIFNDDCMVLVTHIYGIYGVKKGKRIKKKIDE